VRTKLAVSEAADAAAAAALLASLPKDIPANTAAPTRTRARASSPKKVAVPVLDEDIALFIKD
jgi:hypothetical protein